MSCVSGGSFHPVSSELSTNILVIEQLFPASETHIFLMCAYRFIIYDCLREDEYLQYLVFLPTFTQESQRALQVRLTIF